MASLLNSRFFNTSHTVFVNVVIFHCTPPRLCMKTSFKSSSPDDLYVRLRYAFPCTLRSRPFACLSSLALELLAFYTLAILAVDLQLHIIFSILVRSTIMRSFASPPSRP
ncbi:hypothetical protein BDR03DRAFT_658492 [Suillus americanus]|nr:hypothetical protein BDR03DRAFT_658492 [Suillus americanus]